MELTCVGNLKQTNINIGNANVCMQVHANTYCVLCVTNYIYYYVVHLIDVCLIVN